MPELSCVLGSGHGCQGAQRHVNSRPASPRHEQAAKKHRGAGQTARERHEACSFRRVDQRLDLPRIGLLAQLLGATMVPIRIDLLLEAPLGGQQRISAHEALQEGRGSGAIGSKQGLHQPLCELDSAPHEVRGVRGHGGCKCNRHVPQGQAQHQVHDLQLPGCILEASRRLVPHVGRHLKEASILETQKHRRLELGSVQGHLDAQVSSEILREDASCPASEVDFELHVELGPVRSTLKAH
mmetsp:Transcript_40491/g.130149  ORF Transcript_40491/g.130149 Transcript_40491/m.130149 type:complete len:240 (-) Transcript_40491:1285-2004(-)